MFDAAVAEIGRSGLAGADVSAIVAAAGVARGTFYFHFPTKEHVVVEAERAEAPTTRNRCGNVDTNMAISDSSRVYRAVVRGMTRACRQG